MHLLPWPKKEINLKLKIQGGLLSLLFLSPLTHSAPLKIAILDTGFCSESLSFPKNIKIHPSVDLTRSNNFKCNDLKETDRRLHGNWVLKQFLSTLKVKEEVEVFPLIIFDRNAHQQIDSWKKAFTNQENYHLYIIAAGMRRTKELASIEIKTPLFVAGATIGRGIGYKTLLWPQNQYKNPNVFTVGNFSKANKDLPARPDYTLINSTQMKYFFSGGGDSDFFKGTSRATATAAARAINLCYSKFLKKNGIQTCLKENSKEVEIFNDKEKIKILTL
ncbi:hypothetical protein [Halobacteriovorax sp. JY17]|uniref:hypothetical protein n=1 Tax=Halobacteriovorax sp. JY17 TaxID=2014617 RepID=UPI0025C4D390|nr:hypothetical protein [Halobacteriovorax sp. JY17]